MELWDLLDSERNPLGRTMVRGQPVPSGEYHLVVEIWTYNSRKEILLTKRHPAKESYPNYLENSGGSALAGETSKQAAVRELYEETGIPVHEDDLVFLDSCRETSAFHDTYAVKKDIEISALTMQEGETVSAQWVTMKELDELIKNGKVALPVVQRFEACRGMLETLVLGG